MLRSPSEFDRITPVVIEEALRLHRRLGPGLFEKVYRRLLAQALERRGLRVDQEKRIGLEIDGVRFRTALRPDLIVDAEVVVEVKSTEKLAPVHAKQVLTYLRILDMRVGLVLNFGGATLGQGIRRVVNHYNFEERNEP